MRINPTALERLTKARLSGTGLAAIFMSMVQIVEGVEPDCNPTLNLDYQDQDDEVTDGDLIPVISISLRPATVTTRVG